MIIDITTRIIMPIKIIDTNIISSIKTIMSLLLLVAINNITIDCIYMNSTTKIQVVLCSNNNNDNTNPFCIRWTNYFILLLYRITFL